MHPYQTKTRPLGCATGRQVLTWGLCTSLAPLLTQAVTINPNPLPDPLLGIPYSQALSASGGDPPYVFSIEAGLLPLGLSLSNAGNLSGTRTSLQSSQFELFVTDFNGREDVISATVPAAPPLTLPASTVQGTVAYPLSQSFTPSNGIGPYTCSTSSALPTGLSLNSNCTLTGTPSTPGSSTMQLHIVDAFGAQGDASVPINISAALSLNPSTVHATQGYPLTQSLSASGTGPWTCSTASALPAGLSLLANCSFSGSTSSISTQNLNVHVVDALNVQGDAVVNLQVHAPLSLGITSLSRELGVAFSTDLQAGNGIPNYLCSTVSALPAGVTLASNCVLAGTPTTLGSSNLAVHLQDSLGVQGDVNVQLNVQPVVLVLPNPSLNLLVHQAFTRQLTPSNGIGPYSCSTITPLPSGITLSAQCLLSGNPTTIGNTTLQLHVADSLGSTGDMPYAIQVLAPSQPVPSQSGWSLLAMALGLVGGLWAHARRWRLRL